MSQETPQYLAPIQLENCAFTDVQVTAQLDGRPEVNGILINVNFGGGPINENKDRWQITVRVNLTSAGPEKPATYLGTIECIGIFSVSKELKTDNLEQLVMVNGTGMLYASIREMLMIITSRGPYPPVCLMSQSFSVGYKEGKAKENKAKEENQLKH